MTTTAAVGDGGVVFQLFGDEEFAEEEHTSCMGDDELVVAACPSQSGTLCPIALEYRSCVAEGTVGGYAACGGKGMELLLHHIVIVLAIGIIGYLILVGGNFYAWGVRESHADDALHAIHKKTRVETLVDIVGKIVHGGMMPFGYPTAVVVGSNTVNGFGLGYTTGEKAETLCLGFYLVSQIP